MSSDISKLIQNGLEHHRSGRLQEAEAIYQQVLKEQPRNPDAWHLRGVLAHQVGNNEAAVHLIENAIEINPGDPDFYNNCGEAYRALQKTERAISCYEQALAIQPEFAGAHTNLGNILKETGRIEDAVKHYQQAISISPDFVMAHNNLGIAFKELGRPKEAIGCYQKAIGIAPAYAEAHSNLGNAHQELGQTQEAVSCYEQAIAIRPDYAEAHSNLGNALRELERQTEAITHYERAIAISPDFAMAHYNLGIAFEELGQIQQAINCYRQAIVIRPDYAEAHNNLGFALQELGLRDDAIHHYEQALAIKPDYAAAHLHLSMMKPGLEQVPSIERLLEGTSLSQIDASHYNFALGNIYNNTEMFDQAFEHYHRANEFKRSTITHNSRDFSTYVDKLIKTFTNTCFQQGTECGSASELPVFIVGLPRSGTTLVEQILSSHPQVHGAGELVAMQGIEKAIASGMEVSGSYPESIPLRRDNIARGYAEKYLHELMTHSQGATRITDKDPGNFHRLGLIKTLFPGTRIIHCRRNAMDTCTSIFFTYFAKSNTYAFKLDELGQYYLDYERLMAHWGNLFPAEILTVQYEELVMNQEKISRQLIEHIGLEWDDRCLDFHLNKRAVRTTSSVQVRQPIYTRSIDRWKHYQEHLTPLLAILQGSASA